MLSWSAALTLRERLALLRHAGPPQIDPDLAERRLKRWRSEKVFADNPSLFTERLAGGITEGELRSLLGTPASGFADELAPLPEWAASIADALEAQPPSHDLTQFISDPQTGLGRSAGLLRAVAGFILPAKNRLRDALAHIKLPDEDSPFDPKTIEILLLRNLCSHLLGMIHRTLVLELNVARVEEQLAGNTPEQRFESFITRLGRPEVISALWAEYPVLARLIVVAVEQWLQTSLEFLHRLLADWEEIHLRFFSARSPGVITKLRSAGDRHNGGRSVHIIEFSSGRKLVYKPRSLELDHHFQQLLEWINARSPDLQFRTLNILARPGYGWIEFVDSPSCHSDDQIQCFYRRQGGLLALLYVLHASDFHFENLVACGEHPVLIDLETLFQPNLYSATEQDADFTANQQMMNSVFRTGLLPFRFAVNEEQQEGAEISGFGGAAGQKTPYPVPGWEDEATDSMRFARRRVEIAAQRNRPRLQESDVNAVNYSGEIISGFTSIYRLLENHRDDLLSPTGPLAGFAHHEVRCLLRPTSAYSNLLTESYHPNLLRDALDRERLFDNLWAETEFTPLLKHVIEPEREDLWVGDIPMFATYPDSNLLYDSRHRVVPEHCHEPSFHLVQTRLRQLGSEDLNRQLWFIRAAMTALSSEESTHAATTAPTSVPGSAATQADLLQAAIDIGNHLQQTAIFGSQGDVTWIGLDMVKEPFWELSVAGPNLYGGLAGIGLFFLYLANVSGEERFAGLARKSVNTILRGLRNLKEKDKARVPIGAFNGVGGAIYLLTHCAALWQDQELLSQAEEIALSLAPAIASDKSFDVISGSAGLIAVLLNLNRLVSAPQLLDLAAQCGDHLLCNSKPVANSLGWITIAGSSQPLTGFSHGAAGIAWALAKLAVATRQERFREAAIAALNYERNLFSPELSNWPDLRDFVRKGSGPAYATAWCHGASGIGLARIAMLSDYQDAEIHDEINAALRPVCRRRFGASHCLCHGDLGNFETLLLANNTLADPIVAEMVRSYPTELLAGIREHGWRCGVPLAAETPGLMVGTAGIGYGLLRIAFSEKIPSVLSLAPGSQWTTGSAMGQVALIDRAKR